MKHHLKYLLIVILLGWYINVYGQESLTDTTFIYTDVTTVSDIPWPANPAILEWIELYEEYETHCFNDSMKQCFNYFINYNFYFYDLTQGEAYKIPCTKMDIDLGIDPNYSRTGEEWIHTQPSFIGFLQYLKEKRDETY